jgi:hypothetical protein
MKYHDRIFEIFQRLHRLEDYPGHRHRPGAGEESHAAHGWARCGPRVRRVPGRQLLPELPLKK